jgi:hypothetical protein
MIVDRKDFADVVAKRHHEANHRMLPMARLLAAAAPIADGLQRSPEWERYVTYLQGVLNQFAARKQVAMQKLGDPTVTKDEDVRKLRQDVFTADVTVDTLKFCIELPAAILKGGEEADKFIQTFEKKNEAT